MVDFVLDELLGEEAEGVACSAGGEGIDVHVGSAFDGHREDVEDVESGIDGEEFEVLAVEGENFGDVF